MFLIRRVKDNLRGGESTGDITPVPENKFR